MGKSNWLSIHFLEDMTYFPNQIYNGETWTIFDPYLIHFLYFPEVYWRFFNPKYLICNKYSTILHEKHNTL